MTLEFDFGPKGKYNAANLFTASRLPLAAVGMLVFHQWSQLVGVVIIAMAAFTDFLDGKVARYFNCESPFGAEFDPTVDKALMFIVGIWAAIAVVDEPRYVWALIIAEVLVGGLAIFYKSTGVVVKTTWCGKWAMTFKMFAIGLFLMAVTVDAGWLSPDNLNTWGRYVMVGAIMHNATIMTEHWREWRHNR